MTVRTIAAAAGAGALIRENLTATVAVEDGDGLVKEQTATLAPQRQPFCYVVFTSGSTGRPLGVCGTEQGAVCC